MRAVPVRLKLGRRNTDFVWNRYPFLLESFCVFERVNKPLNRCETEYNEMQGKTPNVNKK